MKRNFPDNQLDTASLQDTSYCKMSRYNLDDNCTFELRFLIPSKAAGVIIGKGGENVKDIREKYEIKVNIPDSSGPERVLNIGGRAGAVFEALEIILERVKDCIPASEADVYSDSNKSKNRLRKPKREDEAPMEEEAPLGVDLRMLIHQSQAGGIIGRGGERIKDLREQVDLRTLKLYQNTCPASTDRIVQLVGPIPKVLRCLQSILEMLQSSQPRGAEQPYDAHNYDESQALSYGGWLSKAAFKTVQEYGPQSLNVGSAGMGNTMAPDSFSTANSALAAISAARVNMVNQGTQPPPSRLLPNVAARGGMQQAALAAAASNPMMVMSMMLPGGSGGPGPSNMGVGNRRGMNMMPGVEREMGMTKTVQVSVPNSYMGAIMGRGGSRIRSIREESGSEIRVYEPDKSGSDRIIDITGTQQQIVYAQHLLKSCVLLYHDKK